MGNIILPQVNILSEINDSTNLMVEHNGEINRYPISSLDIGGGGENVLGVEYGGTGATNAEDARKNLNITPENIGAMSMELLWENASPSSVFNAQTVNINLSEYDRVRVEYAATTTYKYCFITECSVGNILNTSFIWGDNGTYAQRSAATSISGISFNAANKSQTKDNTYCIPYKIYGIKGVL